MEADKLLAERDQLREALTELLAAFPGAYYSGTRSQFMSRSQWIETAKLDGWRALVAREAPSPDPDPLNLPAYAWGESVTWNQGRILVPLNRDGETVADLVLDEDAAGTLAAMLDDAAGHKPPDCPRCFDRGYVPDWSRGLSAEHGEPGKKPCPDCQGDAVARETAEQAPHSEEATHADQ